MKYFSSQSCELCPHYCNLSPGVKGLCKVRCGQEEIPFYGFITALAEDPIEKKPLYHYRPGTSILSVGFTGCNLRCPFCQNWRISQNTSVPGHFINPPELINKAKTSLQIAYTYSEPLVHIEYLLDCMTEARKQGLANVLVTNGCINPKAAEELLSLTDAANIDLKCFSEKSYKNILGGDLKTVLNFIKTAFEAKVHVELTTLIVPDFNDNIDELDNCIEFIASLKCEKFSVPWHLSSYHPDWKWQARPTSKDFIIETAERARQSLDYVYTGNIPGEVNNTYCLYCNNILVSRRAYNIDTSGLSLKEGQYSCAFCSKEAPFRFI